MWSDAPRSINYQIATIAETNPQPTRESLRAYAQ
jgi:hypothetical protein